MIERAKYDTAFILAVAEQIRRDGEAHFAPGQKVRDLPLLDPEVMWTLPPSLPLPDVTVEYPRLSDDDMAIILGAK